MEMILAHPNLPWNWYWVSRNPNLTMDAVDLGLGWSFPVGENYRMISPEQEKKTNVQILPTTTFQVGLRKSVFDNLRNLWLSHLLGRSEALTDLYEFFDTSSKEHQAWIPRPRWRCARSRVQGRHLRAACVHSADQATESRWAVLLSDQGQRRCKSSSPPTVIFTSLLSNCKPCLCATIYDGDNQRNSDVLSYCLEAYVPPHKDFPTAMMG